jgi:hypothetical protein
MSGGTFHVHGPHDHELEHAREHAAAHGANAHHGLGGGSMTNQIALFTAVISTVGAVFAYMGGATQANAMLHKNTAAIKKTEASNQWNYYQSKSSKQNLSELALVLVAEDQKDRWRKEIDRYKLEKAEIKLAADKLEEEATEFERKSDAEMHVHHRWAQATTALQVSIALAAIALLTKKRWLEIGMFVVGGLGAAVGVAAALHL